MKIDETEPRTVTYRLTPDKGDEEYGHCMWARYVFDCDNGMLSINSDVGDFSYGWGHNVHEEFMHLMGRVDEGYLLGKLSCPSVFRLEASKEGTVRNLKEYGADYLKTDGQQDSMAERIMDIDSGAGEETFLREVYAIVPGIDWEDIEIVKDYPHGAVTVVQMFIRYLQPKIREGFCG